MKKVINVVLKVLFSLILIMPLAGVFGLFPAPTADLYNTPQAFSFIQILMDTKYIPYINAVVFFVTFVLLWTKRTALAALLVLPITVNIVAFHLVLDGGLFKAGAIMGNVMLLLNIYFLWTNKSRYASLLDKAS